MVHWRDRLPVGFAVTEVQTVDSTQTRRAVVTTDHVHTVPYRRRRHVPSFHWNSLQLLQSNNV